MKLDIGKHSLKEIVEYRVRSIVRSILDEYNLDEKNYVEAVISATDSEARQYEKALQANIARLIRKERSAQQYEKIAEDIRKEITET